MKDFYAILGVERSANLTEIRTAYKKLAMEYHPDRNPGEPEAEEMFKKINEAYHTLSDPLKKSQYDARTNPITFDYSEAYLNELYKRRYYQWQQRTQQSTYRLDKEYFKIQALAFLVFIVISGFCFTIIHTANYYIEQKNLARFRANSVSLKHVNTLFISGQYDEAFKLIQTLKKKDPLEFRFLFAKDSLVITLRNMADERFNHQDFGAAVSYYNALRNYEEPSRFETIRKISLCQYYLGNYKEALQALKHLHNQRPSDLELIYHIGMINLEKLNNPKEALHYFSLGKKLFNDNLSEVYGAAYKVVMNPTDVPDIYFDIFQGRARSNLALENHLDALRDCNWAIFLRPLKPEPYKLRVQASIGLKEYGDICKDLFQAKLLGGTDTDDLARKYCR